MRIGLPATCAAAVLVALAGPAPAQVTCRTNALGTEICIGVPAPTLRPAPPYGRVQRGLGAVQPSVGEAPARTLTPARRTDALGNTFLESSDLPPRRPAPPGLEPAPNCARDALGNLVCR